MQIHANTSECTIREYFVYTEPALILNAKFSASLMLRNLYIGRYSVRYLCFNVTALLEYIDHLKQALWFVCCKNKVIQQY